MNIDFIYTIKNEPCRDKKIIMLRGITDEQLEVLAHVYLNKKMLDKDTLMPYILGIGSDVNLLRPKHSKLIDIIRYATTSYNRDVLIDDIIKFIYDASCSYGARAGRRVAKILLREEKIGIRARDIAAEIKRRTK